MRSRNYLLRIVTIGVALITCIFLISCDEDPTASLGDRIGEKGERPVIQSVAPVGKALNGVSEITIEGQHFSTVFEENLVTFGSGNAAEILEASPNRLVVKAPLVDVPSDSDGVFANIRVAVVGSELASEYHTYRLLETVKEIFVDELIPLQYYGLCVDANTNIYSSAYNLSTGAYLGEYIHPLGGVPSLYNTKDFTHFAKLNFGPDGIILGVRADRVQALFKIVEGAKPEVFAIFDNGIKILDVDTDDQDRIWAAGEGGKIFSVSYPDVEITGYDFEGIVNALRIFNDGSQTSIYASVVRDEVSKIVRIPINGDGTLGAEEEYFDLSAEYIAGVRTVALNFTANGNLYVGNTGINPVIIISPDKTVEVLYPELLQANLVNPNSPDELLSMAWGVEDDMYFVRRREGEFKQSTEQFQNIVRVLTGELSAPYYGRD